MKSPIGPIARKEFLHIIRDPRTLILGLVFPSLMLLLYGYGISLDIRHIPMAILDQDRSAESRRFVGKFLHSGYFLGQHAVQDYEQLTEDLDKGRVKIALAIPANFQERLLRGEKAPVQILVDGSDANSARLILGYVEQIVTAFSASIIVQTIARGAGSISHFELPFDFRPRIWYNPELKSTQFLVPGLVGIICMVITVLLTSLSIVREREVGTLERIIVSPVRGHQLILGKIIPYTGLAVGQVVLVLLTAYFVFGVPVKGSLLLLSVFTLVFLVAALGIGLVISTATETQQAAMVLAFVSALMPSFLLSGFLFPISSMPIWLQGITYLIPARYYLVILRGILLKGVGIEAFWGEAVALVLFAFGILALASLRMRRMIR